MNQVTTQNKQCAPVTAEMLIDKVFERLAASCPILLTVQPEQLKILKRQWVLGFAENGIKTFEQIKRGMAAMRAKDNGYLPSVGEFIKACQFQDYHALGLPNLDELEPRFKKFMGYAKFDSHKFECRSRAEYHLLKTLYDSYGKRKWEDCQKAMPKVLADVAEKVRSNFDFPPIPKMIEEKPKYIDPAVTKGGIANCMAILRGY